MSSSMTKLTKAAGLKRRRRTKGSRLQKRKATAEKLCAKLARKKATAQQMKRELSNMTEELKDLESECSRAREEYQLAIDQNVDLQLSVTYMLFLFLGGGHGGS